MSSTPATRAILTFHQRADIIDSVQGLPVQEIVRGEGVFVHTHTGRKLLDATSSFYVASLGFSHPEVLEAMTRQGEELSFYVSGAGRMPRTTRKLADKIASHTRVVDPYITFASTGSEANEFLMKLLRMRAVWKGDTKKTKVLTRQGSYHGGTLAAASMTKTGRENAEYGLPLDGFLKLAQPNYSQDSKPNESEDAFVARLVDEAESLIIAEGADTVLAFFAEPVSYSAGIIVPPESYFPKMQEMLRRYDIACVADEVITAFGRYGEMFASHAFGFEPDCVTVAKGITGGHFPLSALIIKGSYYQDIKAAAEDYGGFSHGSTYAGHPIGAAAALKVIEILERPSFLQDVRQKIRSFEGRLKCFLSHPAIKDVRTSGLGGVLVFEEGQSSEPAAELAQAFAKRCFDNGVIVRSMGSQALLAPPLIISDDELDEMFAAISASLA